MRWTEDNSPIIVVGVNSFNTEDGAMLSVGQSPYEQGEVAADLARKLIEQKMSPSSLPVRSSVQYIVALRKSALARRKLEIPQIFVAFARATNNYYD